MQMRALAPGETVILLAEDDPVVRNLVRTMLVQAGYGVVAAKDGREALEICHAFTDPIHLLLTDVVMPQMDGLAALKEIMRINPAANVVMVSAMGQEIMVREAVLSGAKGFIVKPFKEDVLLSALSKFG
jgi:two-component system chemotaxis response regulator CheY